MAEKKRREEDGSARAKCGGQTWSGDGEQTTAATGGGRDRGSGSCQRASECRAHCTATHATFPFPSLLPRSDRRPGQCICIPMSSDQKVKKKNQKNKRKSCCQPIGVDQRGGPSACCSVTVIDRVRTRSEQATHWSVSTHSEPAAAPRCACTQPHAAAAAAGDRWPTLPDRSRRLLRLSASAALGLQSRCAAYERSAGNARCVAWARVQCSGTAGAASAAPRRQPPSNSIVASPLLTLCCAVLRCDAM